MGESRALKLAGSAAVRARSLLSGRLFERLRHVAWSALVAGAMYLIFLLEPADQVVWLTQSRIADRNPSGDIVFVGSEETLDDRERPQKRVDLARALDELDRLGVGRVYLDIQFEKSSDAAADQRLAKAIADLGPRIQLVDRIVSLQGVKKAINRTDASIAGNARRVVSDETDRNFFGYAWEASYSYEIEGRRISSLGAALANVHASGGRPFPIDYGIRPARIPSVSIDTILASGAGKGSVLSDVSGKTLVIGHSFPPPGARQSVPGSSTAPVAYVDIYAGETLKSGNTTYLRGWSVIGMVSLLLCLSLLLASSRKRRWTAYFATTVAVTATLVLGAKMGVRMDLSYAFALLTIYGILRSRLRWKRRVEMVNQDTGLPKLRALEARLLRDHIRNGHIVIAKIQNYERVLKSLHAQDKSSYVLRLVDRLRAADPHLAIYCDGHHIGWHTPSDETDAVVEHLEGLRAIFAAPVQVGDLSVDVGITFGTATVEKDPSSRLAAAMAAAEDSSEADNPIVVAETGSQSDLLWDISLRAKIDEAMEAGEIYCVYQPKIELATRTMIGVEALVRWHDPARGFIAPMHFIQQCEKAGRMEHLTRYVLQSACSAGQLLQFRGRPISMSVNISATLLSDMRIVGIVRNVLQATRFDPRWLVLEVTETARITDLEIAASILEELRALGVKISMDDFGVGAASYEAFLALPFDEIKIDRVFVSNIACDHKARAIVSSIIGMSQDARITVVAEGLENVADIHLLEEMGCEQVQGYAFSRPLSLTNLLEFKEIASNGAAVNMV